jgi:hypothetical protein
MFKKIAPDKWRHFYTGIPMGAVLQGLGWWLFPDNLFLVTLIVFLAVCAISYGFELFSKITGMGIYDFMDAVASAIGGVVGIGLTFLLKYLV